MKYILLFFFISVAPIFSIAQGQAKDPLEDVMITNKRSKTKVRTNERGQLIINVSKKDARRIKASGVIRYNDLGAKGDGKTDDIDAIAATHAFANQHNLSVKANDEATYYIGGKNRTAVIMTNTDLGNAAFIIDDISVQDRTSPVFIVHFSLRAFKPEGISSLKRNQKKIDIAFDKTCIVTVTNSNVKRYIRFGPNQNDGSPQTDIFIVDKDGYVDQNAPIIWDFDQVTDITALPLTKIR